MHVALAIYLVGVVIGLWRTDAGPGTRLVVALAWPIGALAFVLTIALLILVAMVVFPAFGATVLALAAIAWWVFSG